MTTLKIAAAAGLIVYMVRAGHLDPKDLWELMTWPNVTVALLLVGLNTFMAAWRWIILVRARDMHLGIWEGYKLYLIGLFFNYAIPGAVGGDVVRGYYVIQDYPKRKMDAALSIFIDRILGLYSFFILSLLAVLWDFEFVMGHEKILVLASAAAIIFLGMTLFFIVSFSQRLSRFTGLRYVAQKVNLVHRLLVAFQHYGKNRMVIAFSVIVSLLAQIFTMIFFYQMGRIMGESGVTMQAVLFAVPLGFLVTALPISPGGIGVGQVAFLYLFETYLSHPTKFGAQAITAFQLTLVAWALVGAYFYIQRRKPKDQIDEMAQALDVT